MRKEERAGHQAASSGMSLLVHPQFVLRPVTEADLPGLKQLAGSIQDGMTSLPAEDLALEEKIYQSLRSFDHRIKKAGGDHYLFVLEDAGTGEVVGASGIIARVGGFDPFYTYEVRTERLVHLPLQIDREITVLQLKLDHKGPSELCSLCLRPDYRKAGLGQLLSLSRFLFMAAFPERFDDRVIAELRGYTDEAGLSPFWEAVGRHFFGRAFAEADFLSGTGQKDFIRDLMPKYPIYPVLLPSPAQSVIGKVHRDAEPALRILQKEGFQPSDEVDIFDAGPLVRAARLDIRTIKRSRFSLLEEIVPALEKQDSIIVAHAALDFRACLAGIEFTATGTCRLASETADRLRVVPGAKIIAAPFGSAPALAT